MKKVAFIFLFAFLVSLGVASAHHYHDDYSFKSYSVETPHYSYSESKSNFAGWKAHSYTEEEYYPYKYNALYDYWSHGGNYYKKTSYKSYEKDYDYHYYPKYYPKKYDYEHYKPSSSQKYPVPPYYYGPKGIWLKPEYQTASYGTKVQNQKWLPVHW